jgi:hypothetical protein|tara:strand:- start:812 stop:1099 length:288 start_codon:yes stop_codon:yes gene_type:complete
MKIISIEEFFRIKEMFSGSEEDKDLALELYNTQYQDKHILNELMLKALLFKDRKYFAEAVQMNLVSKTGKTLYTFLSLEQANDIYKQILDKLMDD